MERNVALRRTELHVYCIRIRVSRQKEAQTHGTSTMPILWDNNGNTMPRALFSL